MNTVLVVILAVQAALAESTAFGKVKRGNILSEAACSNKGTQIHLAFAGGPERMAVSWSNRCVRKEDTHLLKEIESVDIAENLLERRRLKDSQFVTYWEKRNPSKKFRAQARTQRYFLSYHHSAVMTNLISGQEYCYSVAEQGTPDGCFKAGESQPSQGGFTFANLGDMGTNNSAGTIKTIFKSQEEIAFVLHGGDIGYGDDLGFPGLDPHRPAHLKGGAFGYEIVYDEFMDSISPIARNKPYMVVPGNHDVSCNILSDLDCDIGQRNFSAYRARFRMPSEESGAGPVEGMWYSFEYKNVHFTCIDTESDYPEAPTQPWTRFGGGRGGGFGKQIAWLEQDLASARQSPHIDWVVVVGHRQIYSGKIRDFPPGISQHLKSELEPILLKHGVDLYIGAHIHNFERTYPLKEGKRCAANQACPVYIVNGAGGNCEEAEGKGNHHGEIASGVYRKYGFAKVHVENATHMNWKFVVTSEGEVGEIGDEFWVVSSKYYKRHN